MVNNENWNRLDPAWAWDTFQPSQETPWDRRAAAHLYRRAGFAANSEQLEAALEQQPADVVRQFVQSQDQNADFERAADSLAQAVLASGDPKRLSAAWTYRLLHTPNPLREKMTLFWHGHFATSAAKVENADLMWQQHQLLRAESLGNFADLVQGIAQDPAMLIYLDSASNRKLRPNENFARELMELFCLGEGQYSEQDVQQLSRCFTGWEIKNNKFRKNRYQQDRGQKTVLGTSGEFDGEDAVRIVLEQESMPLFIVRKLVRFFVCDEPTASDALVQPLAADFRQSGLQIAPLVQRILSSNLFFSQHAMGRKIRSPVEFALGFLHAVEGTTNTLQLAEGLAGIGQGLFYPPNVKGWDGGRAWINSSTLIGRANLAQRILNDDSTRFAGDNLESFFAIHQVSDSTVIDWLQERLLVQDISPAVRRAVQDNFDQDARANEQRLRSLLHTLISLPDYQIG